MYHLLSTTSLIFLLTGATSTATSSKQTTKIFWEEEIPSRATMKDVAEDRGNDVIEPPKKRARRPIFATDHQVDGMMAEWPDESTTQLHGLTEFCKNLRRQKKEQQSKVPHPLMTDLWHVTIRSRPRWSSWLPHQNHKREQWKLQFASNGFVMDLDTGFVGKWQSRQPGLVTWTLPYTSTKNGDVEQYRLECHADVISSRHFLKRPRMLNGVVVLDKQSPTADANTEIINRSKRIGWFRPVVGTFVADGIGNAVVGDQLTPIE